jgi:DNA-binding response OmpR family regulator
MDKRSILVVEDDPAIRRGVADALQFAGYQVQQAGNTCEGQRLVAAGRYDLILLDVVLPDGSGLDILAEIRERSPLQPVILLTARGEEQDRVNGLRRGADDYIVKPFSVKELLARVEAILRRAGPPPQPQGRVDLGSFGSLDLATCALSRGDGECRELSPREVQLVDYLTRHADRVVSREELLQNVWGLDARGVTTRTIDMHEARLREKLGDDSSEPQVLLTVRGRGYRWRPAPA